MLYVAWKRGLPLKFAQFVLFRPIKKCSCCFNLLCVLDPFFRMLAVKSVSGFFFSTCHFQTHAYTHKHTILRTHTLTHRHTHYQAYWFDHAGGLCGWGSDCDSSSGSAAQTSTQISGHSSSGESVRGGGNGGGATVKNGSASSVGWSTGKIGSWWWVWKARWCELIRAGVQSFKLSVCM